MRSLLEHDQTINGYYDIKHNFIIYDSIIIEGRGWYVAPEPLELITGGHISIAIFSGKVATEEIKSLIDNIVRDGIKFGIINTFPTYDCRFTKTACPSFV